MSLLSYTATLGFRCERCVLAGLNVILKSLGLAERFIELYTGAEDFAVVAFVRADEFRPAAAELGISLEPTL